MGRRLGFSLVQWVSRDFGASVFPPFRQNQSLIFRTLTEQEVSVDSKNYIKNFKMSETEARVDADEQPTAEELKGIKRAAEVR